MATCHSLRTVNGESLGDPLDIRMFEFTGWSFEENAQKANTAEDDIDDSPMSMVRPPPGFEYGIDESNDNATVRYPQSVDLVDK